MDPSTPSRARCSTMVVHPMPPRRRELLLQVRNYVPLAAVGLIATVTWVVLVEPAELSKPPSPRPSNEQLEPERELSVAERFELPSTPTHIRHIGPDDVQVMPVREVTIEGDTTPYEVGTLPKGQKLLTGKNLWLAGPFPVATDRVFLNVTSQASEFSPTLRAQLVDLQTGAILGTYDRVYHQYRTFGVAWGREKDPSSGETRRVLIHVSDGLAVPVEDFGADPERRILVFNAAFGFAVIIQPDDPTSTRGTSHYAVWHDLRSPPPPLTEVLPFVPLPRRPTVDDVLVDAPTALYPYLGPTVVWGEEAPEDCKRASFWPGESRHRCHHRHVPLTHEWSLIEPYLDRPLAVYHHFTDTLHVLDLNPEPCTFVPGVTVGSRNPLRLLLRCRYSNQMVWTPEGLFREPDEPQGRGLGETWNRDRTFLASADSELGSADTEWLDVQTPRRLVFTGSYHDPITPFLTRNRIPTVPLKGEDRLWAIDIDSASRIIRDHTAQCADIDYEADDGDWWAYSCRNGRRGLHWFELANVTTETRYELTRTKDALVDVAAKHVLIVERAGTQDIFIRAPLPEA